MSDIKKYVVIVAGGKGARMGTEVPKQFLPLASVPLMCYSIKAFAAAMPDVNIILVLPVDQLGSAQTVLRSYIGNIKVTTIAGGETRFHSVRNGLKMVQDDGIVFIHDGARPLISEQLILRCYNQALEKGSAVPAIAVTESIRQVTRDGSFAIDRDELRIIQTPQTFRTNVILPAFQQGYHSSFSDEASVLEAFNTPIHLIDGCPENIKVTWPKDITIAEALLDARVLHDAAI